MVSFSLHGNQEKGYDALSRLYYKFDSPGRQEALVEHIVSAALDHITLDGNVLPHVRYAVDDRDGRIVSICKNFLGPREIELPFSLVPYNISDNLTSMFNFIESVETLFGLKDISLWLGCVFTIDCLFYNEDRHLNNLSLIQGVDGSVRYAPIFDNGAALGFHQQELPYSIFEPNPFCMEQLYAVPALLEGKYLSFDYTGFKRHYEPPTQYVRLISDSYLRRLEACVKGFPIPGVLEVV